MMSPEMQKEITALRETLHAQSDWMDKLLQHSAERDVKVDAMVAKVDEMYKVFNNGTFLVSVIKWGFGLVLAVGGGYLMFKQILHGQN